MKQKFEVGDVVQLISGGPEMAVSRVLGSEEEENLRYRCQWFAGKKLDSGDFPQASLSNPTPKD